MRIHGKQVVDAPRNRTIHITNRDVKRGGVKDPYSCAAALACKRDLGCTEARVNVGRTYLRKGNKWVRFLTPTSLKYEIVAFDRGGQFEPGEYVLLAPKGRERLGSSKPTGPKRRRGKPRQSYHMTANIRTSASADHAVSKR
jgi:hypothetical protein